MLGVMRSAFPREGLEEAGPGLLFEQQRPRARPENGIDDPRQAGVPAEDPGHGGEVPRRGQHADLDPPDGRPFGQTVELARHGPGGHRKDAVHALRALRGHGREDAEAALAEPLEDPDIEKDAGGGRGVPARYRDQALHTRILPRTDGRRRLTFFRALEY